MRGFGPCAACSNPDGAMHLMVYAPYGRTGIYMLQEFCRSARHPRERRGDSRSHRRTQALPSGHPLETLLREAPDFRHEAALADALLHPRDRAYSVPQFFDFLEDAALTFGRWVRQAPYSPRVPASWRESRKRRESHASHAPEQFAVAELFRGTMVRHSAIVYRDDDPPAVQHI